LIKSAVDRLGKTTLENLIQLICTEKDRALQVYIAYLNDGFASMVRGADFHRKIFKR